MQKMRQGDYFQISLFLKKTLCEVKVVSIYIDSPQLDIQ